MNKHFIVTMPDGSEWAVPVAVIAQNRATYYAPRLHDGDVAKSLKETEEIFEDDEEIAEWAGSEMNWDDVKAHAKQVKEPDPVDYDDGWVNGRWEVEDLKNVGSPS